MGLEISPLADLAKVLVTQKAPLYEVAGTVVSKAGTVTGTAGVGSSLFLQRIFIPTVMSLSEIDVAMSIGFPATNQGAGTMSRSMVIYQFGNSTSLASVVSVSGTSAWNTGTVTAGASTSLTQFQAGWSTPQIQAMTFAASSLSRGDYVVGQLFNFAQGSSTWTLNFYGAQGQSTFLASAATNLTSATLGAISAATVAGSGITGISSYASQFLALSTAGSLTAFRIQGTASTAASSQTLSVSTWQATLTNTAKSCSFQLAGESSNSNIISSVGTVAGSIINGITTLGAVTNVALGALNSSTLAQAALANFGFIGTNSTTSGFPTWFEAGIMSTGAVPTAITATSAAVTFSGSAAFQQPWFALVGS
jgi:trimeric autotransporter adhesin